MGLAIRADQFCEIEDHTQVPWRNGVAHRAPIKDMVSTGLIFHTSSVQWPNGRYSSCCTGQVFNQVRCIFLNAYPPCILSYDILCVFVNLLQILPTHFRSKMHHPRGAQLVILRKKMTPEKTVKGCWW